MIVSNAKKYSVYSAKDEMPVLIYASAKECAEFMGITENAFFRFICRMRSGKYKQRKWLVYEDED